MKKTCRVILLTFLILAIPLKFTALAMDKPYAFEVHRQSEEKMRVEFLGNQMYHNGRYLGFGANGKPMLSQRYMAKEVADIQRIDIKDILF